MTEKKPLAVLAGITIVFLGLKLFSLFIWQGSGEDKILQLTGEVLMTSLLILFGIGSLVRIVWNSWGVESTDHEIALVGGGVFGLSLFSGLCLGGFCIPAAVMSSIFTLPLLVPVAIGIKLGGFFRSYREKE